MESGGEKKQKIIETAKRIFAEKSFFDATLEEISELSGVKKSTIYYYFESKLDLLMEILETIIRRVTARIDELLLLEDRKEIIRSLIDGYFEFFLQEKDLVLLLHRVGFDLLSHEEAHRRMEAIFTHLQSIWDKVAERIGDIQSRSGVVIEGRKLVRMISASVVGYCVEELKREETIGNEDREFFKEIFTAF
ncbi:MAG: TetR/AcrR family transcriptional regulator [Candidatus Atribacteria bacterium]|nr:TetR/AcrR family transcriptional regulator [Candidatus Atribacteria bacterium]